MRQRAEYVREYEARPDRKAARRAIDKKHRDSPQGKAVRRAFELSPHGKKMRRVHALRRLYGLTLEGWDALFLAQDKRCAVCKSPDPFRKPGLWATDHNHTTGKVRGILCNRCNVAIGMAGDDPLRLRLLAEYLEERG